MANFRLEADIRGARVNASWTWNGPVPDPGLRLLRRKRAFPAAADDGDAIFDVADAVWESGQAWGRVEREI